MATFELITPEEPDDVVLWDRDEFEWNKIPWANGTTIWQVVASGATCSWRDLVRFYGPLTNKAPGS